MDSFKMEDVMLLHSGILDLADTRKVNKITFTELVDQPQIFLHVYKDLLRVKDSITGVFVWGISFRVNPPFHIDDLWIWLLRIVPLSRKWHSNQERNEGKMDF